MRSFCHKIKGLMKIFTSSFGRAVEEWGIKSIQNSIIHGDNRSIKGNKISIFY